MTGLGLGSGSGGGVSPGGSTAFEERSGSRNSQEAKPSRLASPALEIAHQVISASNRTRPMVTISPRLRVTRTSPACDIFA